MRAFLHGMVSWLKNDEINKSDIFISYSHRNLKGIEYAENLRNRLRVNTNNPSAVYDIFIDQKSGNAQRTQPEIVDEIAQNSGMMVVVGTKEAFESPTINREIRAFFSKGKSKPLKVIYPDSLSNEIQNAVWIEDINSITNTLEEKEENLFSSNSPSDDVIRDLFESFTFPTQQELLKRSERKIRQRGLVSLVFTFLAIVSGILAFIFSGQVAAATRDLERANAKVSEVTGNLEEIEKKAEEAFKLAEEENNRADSEAQRADSESNRANTQSGLARIRSEEAKRASKLADEKTKLAQAKTLLADKEANRAEEEMRRASVQESIAIQQESIAETRRLTNESSISLKDRMTLMDARVKSLRANEKVDSRGLDLTEPISGFREVLMYTPKRLSSTKLSLAEEDLQCDHVAFSINQTYFACQKGLKVAVKEISKSDGSSIIYDLSNVIIGDSDVLVPTRDPIKPAVTSSPCTGCLIRNVTISDMGGIAIGLTKEYVDEDGKRDGIFDSHGIVVMQPDGKGDGIKTDEIGSLLLNPSGDTLVFVETNSSQGELDLGITRLKLWRTGGLPEIVECQYSAQVSTLRVGNFSPDGKRFIALNDGLTASSVEIREFVNDSPKPPASCKNSPMVETEPDALSGYFVRSYKINSDVGMVSVNNTGDMLAVGSWNVSIWDVSSYPILKVIVPDRAVHLGWNRSDSNFSSVVLGEGGPVASSWLINGYEYESREESRNEDGLNEVAGFFKNHPELETTINGRSILIRRKSDSAVVDFISLDENRSVLGVIFSADGREMISKSYDTSRAVQINAQLDGYQEYYYERWKIGYKELDGVFESRVFNRSNSTKQNGDSTDP